MSYLDDFFKDKTVRANPESKYALETDKWDRKIAQDIYREIREYQVATKALGGIAQTGPEALRDALISLFKFKPELRNPKEVRPSFLINHRVESEMMKLKEYEKLHASTRGDSVSAGLAAVDIEPELEILFDKMNEERKTAQQLEEMLQSAEALSDDLDEALQSAIEAAESGEEEEAKNYQDQASALEEQLEELKQKLEEKTQELEGQLDDASPSIREALEKGLGDAQENADTLSMFDSWSMNEGSLKRLDPAARIALSKRLQTERFKKMAQIIGRLQSMAMSEQVTKTDHAQEEIFDITKGNNLSHMLPLETLYMSDPIFKWDWMRRFVENNIIQYDLRGTERVEQGGIILLEDGSGSMSGEREMWSKAIGLALLKIATLQKRPFTCIHFGSVGEYILFEFDTSHSDIRMTMSYDKTTVHYSGAQAIVEFADKTLRGGTDFATPMKIALEILDEEFESKGLTESDIVFLTDGQCGVHPKFLNLFKERQAALEFKVYGVAICTNPKSEPLRTICDNNVVSVHEIADLTNMKPIFGSI